jgi:uncharacterized membrane protein YagU involved in acid resistance
MASAQRLNWARVLARGAVAGIMGGILIDAFLYAATLAPNHEGILRLWQFIASSAFGKVAYTSLAYAWAGLAMHLLVSIAWGIGYSYLSATQPAVNASPIFSGVLFGIIVYVVMQLALASVGLLVIRSASQVLIAICAHTIFFGVPVALVNDWQRPRLA